MCTFLQEFARSVFSLKNCAPLGAKIMIHWDNFPGSTVPITGTNVKGSMPHVRHEGAPLPTLYLLFTTVPHSGQNIKIRGDNISGSLLAISALIQS